MDWATSLTIAVSVLLAATGYVWTYLYNLRLARRKDRLDRVNRQLSDLYGPLYALTHSADTCWKVFRSRYRPGGGPFWDPNSPPTEEEAAAWRLWMAEVFMPLNVAMADVVTQHIDLLDEETMPDVLLRLCAHVKVYRPVIKRWEAGDFSENTSGLNFPREELLAFASDGFRDIMRKQRELLGHKSN